MPTHRDDNNALDRAMTTWQQRGPKYQPFGAQGRPLAALRHTDGRAKILTVPADTEPDELAGNGWEVVTVIKPYEEGEDATD